MVKPYSSAVPGPVLALPAPMKSCRNLQEYQGRETNVNLIQIGFLVVAEAARKITVQNMDQLDGISSHIDRFACTSDNRLHLFAYFI